MWILGGVLINAVGRVWKLGGRKLAASPLLLYVGLLLGGSLISDLPVETANSKGFIGRCLFAHIAKHVQA